MESNWIEVTLKNGDLALVNLNNVSVIRTQGDIVILSLTDGQRDLEIKYDDAYEYLSDFIESKEVMDL